MRIDAHQHYWRRDQFDYRWTEKPGLEKLQRDYLPADLDRHLRSAQLDGSIVVQTQHNNAENDWALGLARENSRILGVVGWLDLTRDDLDDQLARYRQDPLFVGLRHITQDEPDDDFIVREAVLHGLATLEKRRVPFDLLFYAKHLKHADRLGRRFPNLPMVIDHLAKPEIKQKSLDPWRQELRNAAKHPNIFCKLSGLVTEADWERWTPSDLRPYLETALEAFGPERLMYGSDWPVCLLASSYERVFGVVQDFIQTLTSREQSLILGETARLFYGVCKRE